MNINGGKEEFRHFLSEKINRHLTFFLGETKVRKKKDELSY